MFKKCAVILIFGSLVSSSELLINVRATSCGEPDEALNPILSDGSFNFALNLYNELKDGKNLFFSPFSVRVALAMTAEGAGGSTLSQMHSALALTGFGNEDERNLAFRSLLGSFCANDKFTLSTANRIYVDEACPVETSFRKTITEYYSSSEESVDFLHDPSGAAEIINRWVEERTDGTIKELISPNSLSSDTVMVLVNAIYFKGVWKTRFDPANTKPRAFNLADGRSVEVPTMFAHSDFKMAYNEDLNVQVLQLNYDGNRLAMFIVLPSKSSSLSKLQRDLTAENMKDFFTKDLHIRQVAVYLPKFKVSYGAELGSPLAALGMSEAFQDSADFSRMTSASVKVSQVVHRAFVAVDEDGTTAAAATAVIMMAKSANFVPKPEEFRVDRPCVYFIYDLEFKQVLFFGNLDDPSSSS